MKVLVTGVKGQLGHDVVMELEKRGHQAIGVDLEEMDITDAEMVRQVPEAVFEETEAGERLMKRGVIVRHLLLPGQSMDSRRVLRYLHETYGNRIYISIMNQYTPMRRFDAYPELNRRVSGRVYERLVDSALALGIENGFIQEGGTAKESFVPLWDGTGL